MAGPQPFRVELSRQVTRAFEALPAAERARVAKALDALECEPRPQGKQVKAIQGAHDAFLRYRVGDCRLLYTRSLRATMPVTSTTRSASRISLGVTHKGGIRLRALFPRHHPYQHPYGIAPCASQSGSSSMIRVRLTRLTRISLASRMRYQTAPFRPDPRSDRARRPRPIGIAKSPAAVPSTASAKTRRCGG